MTRIITHTSLEAEAQLVPRVQAMPLCLQKRTALANHSCQ